MSVGSDPSRGGRKFATLTAQCAARGKPPGNFTGTRMGGTMRNALKTFLLLAAFGVLVPGGSQAADSPEGDLTAIGHTPARLSLADGRVSFWRPGAPDWAQAAVNTPVAPGDQLATGSPGSLELQIGPRGFIRAGGDSYLGLSSHEPDFLQIKLTAGTAFVDLRGLDPGETVEVDTPNAAISIGQVGYYRIEVTGERTAIIARRGGRATVTPASGGTVDLMPSEEVVVEGLAAPQLASYAAPPRDVWDRWNYARTDALLHATSARYVSPGTYGVDELDRYGTWRTVPEYGAIWVPTSVPADWVPYSSGSWIADPVYGWTWVSSMPWGWAPFHYGRWVHAGGYWAWAPGPVVTQPVYAPALVAFLGTPGIGVSVGAGQPLVGWVALGWGEPCLPWWGPASFVHRPWWGGWAGPHVVNNVVVTQATVVHEQQISVYRNAAVQNAVVAVDHQHFGRGPITDVRARQVDVRSLQPLRAGVPVQPTAASLVPSRTRGGRPPDELLRRPVIATRAPQPHQTPAGLTSAAGPGPVPAAPVRVVPVSRPSEQPAGVLSRPPFGGAAEERPGRERGASSGRQRDQTQPTPAPRAASGGISAQGRSSAPAAPPAAPSAPAPAASIATPRPAPGPAAPGGAPSPMASRPAGPPSAPAPAIPQAPPVRQQARVQSPSGAATPSAVSPPRPAAIPATPVPQATPPRPGGMPPLPGEPANRVAPHRMEAARPAPPPTRVETPRPSPPGSARESHGPSSAGQHGEKPR